jgi:hypothetical protein
MDYLRIVIFTNLFHVENISNVNYYKLDNITGKNCKIIIMIDISDCNIDKIKV